MNAKSYRKELLADSLLIVLPLFLGFFLPVSSESVLRITWQFVFPLTTLGMFWLIAYLGIWKGRFETMKPDVVRWTLFLQPMISLAVCAMFCRARIFSKLERTRFCQRHARPDLFGLRQFAAEDLAK